ncbi:class I SAM-dependent methyltransferase [Cryptosporangium aurantiacum]|uniref:Methyltransferase domain-containing protein n=1 Tax=Cryptosporangium aurantiacum TaxID=134849 RepID=A0A1M7PC38_9ACTN|nr:class I SAM-dependent methyltransferase [Cryptosporangium aurantiacum]SHN14122.1 Methyltransferase domain-containing protein [Cryptosporangium aurantiacum]
MPDPIFDHPRLVAVYDALEGDRPDLDVYEGLVDELGAERILDIGCGTGILAVRLAAAGKIVTGVDPAPGSIDHARNRPGGQHVNWIRGEVRDVVVGDFDLATMTGNVAQAIVDRNKWDKTLAGTRRLLRPGGHLVFETRVPEQRAWELWTRELTERTVDVDGIGPVRTWTEVVDLAEPLVTFRASWVFPDGAVLSSHSTLRFRSRREIEASLRTHGYELLEVRDAPDRPGLEWVFLARRAPSR